MLIDVAGLSPNKLYHTMIQTLIPRPVAWVLTANEEVQGYNLAPFSYFTPVSSQPPTLMLSIGKKPNGDIKDTRRNILTSKKFVVHISGADNAEWVTASAGSFDYAESEVDKLGLLLEDFGDFSLPRLSCCDIAYACELTQSMELGDVPQALLFGEVRQIYINDRVMTDQGGGRLSVDAGLVNPLARLGGDDYWVDGSVTTVKRPK